MLYSMSYEIFHKKTKLVTISRPAGDIVTPEQIWGDRKP